MNAVPVAVPDNQPSVIGSLASHYGMDRRAFEATLRATVMPQNASNEQAAAFLLVAKEHGLNPFTREIFAFPAKGGGIQPVVSVDGWMKLINSHPSFDGMEFADKLDEKGQMIAVTCRIFRKDRSHPVEVTEYMGECRRDTDTWKRWPARMLRHKAAIQAARYAFGFAGIMEPDEAERATEVASIRPDRSGYSEKDFEANFPKWQAAIESGRKTADEIVALIESKSALTEQQRAEIQACAQHVVDAEVQA